MRRVILSCFNDGTYQKNPVALDWANTLCSLFPQKYKITVLLHGECIKYCLKKNNKYKKLLKKMHEKGIRFRVCGYCLEKDGYNPKNKLDFVKIIKFSVDYIIERNSNGVCVVYDNAIIKN